MSRGEDWAAAHPALEAMGWGPEVADLLESHGVTPPRLKQVWGLKDKITQMFLNTTVHQWDEKEDAEEWLRQRMGPGWGRYIAAPFWMTAPKFPWPRVHAKKGVFWVTPWGNAYGDTCPPAHSPLSAGEVQALPAGTRVLVLWGGGNGPHAYAYDGEGRVNVEGDRPGAGVKLGGVIGSWDLVGGEKFQDKVWTAQEGGEE